MVEAEEGIEGLLEGRCMTEGLTTSREEKGKGPLTGRPGQLHNSGGQRSKECECLVQKGLDEASGLEHVVRKRKHKCHELKGVIEKNLNKKKAKQDAKKNSGMIYFKNCVFWQTNAIV